MVRITAFTIILAIFIVFAWSRAYLRWREKTMNIKELLFWSLIWIGALTAIFVPAKTDVVAHLFGVSRGSDAIFALSIITLLYAVYRLYSKFDAIEQQLTQLVRELALANHRPSVEHHEPTTND